MASRSACAITSAETPRHLSAPARHACATAIAQVRLQQRLAPRLPTPIARVDYRAGRNQIDHMHTVENLTHFSASNINTLALAGGGNRCWWQAGVVTRLLDAGWQLPGQLVGTSAGAGVAASFITDGPHAALAACMHLYSQTARILDRSQLRRLKFSFAHQQVYPAWISSFLHEGNFAKIQASSTRLRVGLTRPAAALGVAGSIAVGSLAYVIDKYLWNSIHPRLPKALGLRQEFVDLHTCKTVQDAQTLLSAAAAAPPFMSARHVGGSSAIDGGYTDNAPIHAQSDEERRKTLVLLTRHYPTLPAMFRMAGRSYWQPSTRVPVSTWDCTARTTVREAFDLGSQDAERAIEARRLSLE